MKNRLFEIGHDIKEKLWEISDFIYANPELGNEEFKAVEKLTAFLESHNFKIEREFLGIPTAFRATFESSKSGKTIGYLCE